MRENLLSLQFQSSLTHTYPLVPSTQIIGLDSLMEGSRETQVVSQLGSKLMANIESELYFLFKSLWGWCTWLRIMQVLEMIVFWFYYRWITTSFLGEL